MKKEKIIQWEKERQKFIEALIWCSGSEDFQIGGKARRGWEKICLPLLRSSKYPRILGGSISGICDT